MIKFIRICFGWLCFAWILSTSQVLAAVTIESAITQAENMTPVALLPRADMLRQPDVYGVALSPDGKLLSYVKKEQPISRKLASLWIYDLATKHHRKLFAFKDIRRIYWSADSTKVFLNTGYSLAVSDVKAGAIPKLTAKFDTKLRERPLSIDFSRDAAMLVRLWHVKDKRFEIFRVNGDASRELVYQFDNEYSYLLLNNNGEPDLIRAQNQTPGSKREVQFFDANSKKLVWQCPWDDSDCAVHAYDRKRNRLLMTSNQGVDLTQLVWIDIATKSIQPIHSDPQQYSDLSRLSISLYGGMKPLIVGYHGDTYRNYTLDKDLAEHLTAIEKALGQQMLIINVPELADPLKTHWLIKKRSNEHVNSRYYLYDPKNSKLERPLVALMEQNQGQFKDELLAPKFAIRYATSDDYQMQGYLTLPRGVELKSAPMVVNVHGGPWSRVQDGVDRHNQVLANRGYIVFEPNFRASSGFGKHHMLAIKNDYGDGRIQQDIIDGVHYLLAKGLGDKQRLGIIGHSFGGFSTLTALSVTPELFQVGFAGAPPTDLGRSGKLYYRFQKKVNGQFRDHFMKTLVVDWDDKAAYARNLVKQPVSMIDQLTKPLVIWAGKNDRRVFIVDVRDYALQAQSLDKSVSLFVDGNAMHSPEGETGKEAYMYLIEKTLAAHLKGKLQALEPRQDRKLLRYVKKLKKIDHADVL